MEQQTFNQTVKTASAAVKEYSQNPFRLDKELMKCAARNEYITTNDGAQSVRAVSKMLLQHGNTNRRNGFDHTLFEKDNRGRFVRRVRVNTMPLIDGPDGLEVTYFYKGAEYVPGGGCAYRLQPIPCTLQGFFAAYCRLVKEDIAAAKAAAKAAEKAAKAAEKAAKSEARRLNIERKDVCRRLSAGQIVPAAAIEMLAAIDARLNSIDGANAKAV